MTAGPKALSPDFESLSRAVISPLGLLENWWVPDPKVPTALLDWKTVVWTLAQNSPPGLLSHRSEHGLARHSWGAFPRSLDHAGYELGGPGGFKLSPCLCICQGSGVLSSLRSSEWSRLP